jgi:hypothetical protein
LQQLESFHRYDDERRKRAPTGFLAIATMTVKHRNWCGHGLIADRATSASAGERSCCAHSLFVWSEISAGVVEGESNKCGGVERDELLLIRGRLSTRSSAMHPSDERELIPTGEPQTAICHSGIDSLKSSLSKTSRGPIAQRLEQGTHNSQGEIFGMLRSVSDRRSPSEIAASRSLGVAQVCTKIERDRGRGSGKVMPALVWS